MDCPHCRVKMRPQLMGEALVEVQLCPACRGAWLDKGKALHFVPKPRELLQSLSEGLLVPQPSSLVCPRCQESTLTEGGLVREDVRVGLCGRCGGLWLAAGTLKRLVDAQLPTTATTPPSAPTRVDSPGPTAPSMSTPVIASPGPPPMRAVEAPATPVCPACRTSLTGQLMGESMVKVLTCGVCHGAWFERGAVLNFVSRPQEVASAALLDPKASSLLCPWCMEGMYEGGLIHADVRVALCRRCGGLWLRAGALKRLNEALSSPGPALGSAPAQAVQPAVRQAPTAARHARGATRGLWGMFWSFFFQLKWQYLPMLLSDYGREILRRKYDAFATDRAYENRPSGLFGPIGGWVDRVVLNMPLHEALRQRLRLVVDNLEAEVKEHLQRGESRVRVLSAPCGLIRDLLVSSRELALEDPRIFEKLELHALDLDATDEVLSAASRRAALAGVAVRFHQDDLFNPRSLNAVLAEGTRFHVINCIGLTAWLDLAEVEHLARFFHDRVLVKDGSFIVDNWAQHKQSALGADLGIPTRYHDPATFVKALETSGFRIKGRFVSANGVVTVYVARAVASPDEADAGSVSI